MDINKLKNAFLLVGGIYGLAIVIMSAVLGHDQRIFEPYVFISQLYFMFNTLVILLISLILAKSSNSVNKGIKGVRSLLLAGVFFIVGAPLFSYAVFQMGLDYSSIAFVLMPVGGSLTIIAWLLVIYYAIKQILCSK